MDLPHEKETGGVANTHINVNVSGNGGGGSIFRQWPKWREADERPFLKRVARAAVEDARRVVGAR